MVPYSSFMSIRKQQGLNEINRYNMYPSAAIQGAPAKGYSSGQVPLSTCRGNLLQPL
jgi:hydrophobic/amphiphilic exporter-1 (mainly G- bacteria), HAE1 family